MKPSYYNIFLDNYPKPEKSIVYNTRTQALGVFDTPLASKLQTMAGKTVDLDEKEFRSLLTEGFCVNDEDDEKMMLEEWFSDVCYNKKDITATILTTYSCNFSCPYCFEKNSSKKVMNMDKYTADILCSWLCINAKEKGAEKIDVCFYGGEPLMNKDVIYHIAKKMKKFADENNVRFKFGIITNGYLIRAEDTKRLTELGLEFYRITLDGSDSWHNKTRFLKNGKPTFERIINNIKNNTADTKVLISSNITKDNYSGIVELIDFLSNHDIKSKIHSLDFAPIIDIPDENVLIKTAQCMSKRDDDTVNQFMEIRKLIKEKGFKNSRNKIGMHKCPFKIDDTDITITPDGHIYKCPMTVGKKEFSVGYVCFLKLNKRNNEILSNDRWKECYPCAYLPVCQGGCYYSSYLNTGDMFSIDCNKTLLLKTLPEMLKEQYELLS